LSNVENLICERRDLKKSIDKSKRPENRTICGEAGEILPAATRHKHHLYNVKDSEIERRFTKGDG